MPIISLSTPTQFADASHQVTAPGGYERWHFDAEDSAGQMRMVAVFYQGYVFHPAYLRAYNKYRWWPTRNAPPVPASFPCVCFNFYRGNQAVAQFIAQFPTRTCSAAVDRLDVSMGPNRVHSNEDGSLDLIISGENGLSAQFHFAPRAKHPPVERRFLSRASTGADHHWVIANPLCDVSGQIETTDSATGRTSQISIDGPGYHDHAYGTGPIGPGLKRWMWGRVLMEDHAAMFQFAQPRDLNQPDDIHMHEADSFGLRELPVDRFNADWSRKTKGLLRYPAWVEAGAMQLVNPRVIDATPFSIRLIYDASVRGASGQACCEVAYPNRLVWPLIGKRIEKSIQFTSP